MVVAVYLSSSGDLDQQRPQAEESVTPSPDGSEDVTLAAVPTELIMEYRSGAGAFKGSVESADARCVTGREVIVKWIDKGPDSAIGNYFTQPGEWKVEWSGHAGRYYAVVTKKTYVSPTGTKVVCARGRSPTITLR